DEVRAVGAELGLPERLVWRQPFPGPGLAIRIVGGEVNRGRLDGLRAAAAGLPGEIRAAGLYKQLLQSVCVVPGVRPAGGPGAGWAPGGRAAPAPVGRGPAGPPRRRRAPRPGPAPPTTCSSAPRTGSSTRSRASPASRSTSPRSPPRPSRGSSGAPAVLALDI